MKHRVGHLITGSVAIAIAFQFAAASRAETAVNGAATTALTTGPVLAMIAPGPSPSAQPLHPKPVPPPGWTILNGHLVATAAHLNYEPIFVGAYGNVYCTTDDVTLDFSLSNDRNSAFYHGNSGFGCMVIPTQLMPIGVPIYVWGTSHWTAAQLNHTPHGPCFQETMTIPADPKATTSTGHYEKGVWYERPDWQVCPVPSRKVH